MQMYKITQKQIPYLEVFHSFLLNYYADWQNKSITMHQRIKNVRVFSFFHNQQNLVHLCFYSLVAPAGVISLFLTSKLPIWVFVNPSSKLLQCCCTISPHKIFGKTPLADVDLYRRIFHYYGRRNQPRMGKYDLKNWELHAFQKWK